MAKSKQNNGLNSRAEERISSEQLPPDAKVPPYSLELEMNVLGGMIIDNSLIDIVTGNSIKSTHFYKSANAEIFKTIVEMHDRHEPVDLITLTEEMKLKGLLDAIGGPYYLTELTTSFSSAENIGYSANRILEYWLKRDLINITSVIRDQCFDPATSTDELLNNAQREILDITNILQREKYRMLRDEISTTMNYVESLHERNESVIGVPSGYTKLDGLTGGFQNSDLIIIAGRPSMGKTAFALSIARNAAVDYGKTIGIFSIEMSVRELSIRFLCAEAKVDIMKLKTGRLPETDWSKISENFHRLTRETTNILIDPSSPLTLLELRAKSRRMKAEHNVDMVIVDYLQLMEVPGSKNIDRYLEIGYITRGLKQLAKELDIPVVALSQLSRKVEDRGKDKRPLLSDLRESGSIEQDADVVIFVNRPEMYLSKDDPKYADAEGVAEIIIGKQRNGPTDMLKLTFIKDYARFENPTYEPEPAYYMPGKDVF